MSLCILQDQRKFIIAPIRSKCYIPVYIDKNSLKHITQWYCLGNKVIYCYSQHGGTEEERTAENGCTGALGSRSREVLKQSTPFSF